MKLKIKTRTIGANFGTVGIAVASDGREVFASQTRPLGFDSAAESDVVEWARAHGHTVARS